MITFAISKASLQDYGKKHTHQGHDARGARGTVDGIYQDYIDGKRELADINREYSERFAGRQRR